MRLQKIRENPFDMLLDGAQGRLALNKSALRSVVVTGCLLAALSAFSAGPEDSTQIGEIEANPDAYHLRQVTLKGRVHEVQMLDPYFQPSGAACTGAYLFTLQDETGYLQVVVLGVCGVPIARSLEVTEGDDVVLQGVIHAPGRFGTFYGLDGRRRSDKTSPPLHAIAKELHRLEPQGPTAP